MHLTHMNASCILQQLVINIGPSLQSWMLPLWACLQQWHCLSCSDFWMRYCLMKKSPCTNTPQSTSARWWEEWHKPPPCMLFTHADSESVVCNKQSSQQWPGTTVSEPLSVTCFQHDQSGEHAIFHWLCTSNSSVGTAQKGWHRKPEMLMQFVCLICVLAKDSLLCSVIWWGCCKLTPRQLLWSSSSAHQHPELAPVCCSASKGLIVSTVFALYQRPGTKVTSISWRCQVLPAEITKACAHTLNNRYRYTNQDVYPRPTNSSSFGTCIPHYMHKVAAS